MDPAELKAIVRTIPDFPKPGILFRDITTLIAHGRGFAATIDRLVDRALMADASAVAGIEARGFIFGAAVAARLGIGFIPLRKPGKLPMPTIGVDYQLEYGEARLELDPGAVEDGEKVLLMDDLLATGGTALAAVDLLRQAGARVHHALFVIDLHELKGGHLLREEGLDVQAIMQFDGE
ncbi:adenine phosphoribosyltransferase [Altererythrobacter indicus]|uniref:Adenine phosphoribosyltransferase n=1 Tax=Altericroceibacterium indicum TaxID=374177 RepID=A0A845AJ88_9SPHN|nr:adenine phosphoribosyltransferase [Altericroceibacterium indicum]MXP27158.1 adenine phosphoribosyltransferase [Altericroceibacterium indicum]